MDRTSPPNNQALDGEEDEASKVLTGLCVNWANNSPTWRVAGRCYRWTGSRWVKCGFWTTCTNIS
jgi:hypothetical protein